MSALVKFTDDAAARNLISEALRGREPTTVAAALRGLAIQQYELPVPEVVRLMQSGDETIQLATLSYVQTTRNRQYLPVIRPYAAGASGRLGSAASRVVSLMDNAQK